MPLTAEQRTQRARLAARARHTPAAPDLDSERRDFRAARLEDAVRDGVAGLSPEQRRRIADVALTAALTGGRTG